MSSPHGAPDRTRVAPSRSLVDSFMVHWRADGRRAILHDDLEGWITGDEIEQRSRDAAEHFVRSGLRPGDRVVVSAGATARAVVWYIGALRAGLVVVPVNTMYRDAEVAHIARDAAVGACVVDERRRADWISAATGRSVVLVDVAQDAPRGPSAELPQPVAEDPALLVYTSGTTGTPKGALLSHANLLWGAEALRVAWHWTPDDRLVHALPLFHLHGLGAALNGSLHAGSAVLLRSRFDPADVLVAASEHSATMFFGVPTMYLRLAEDASVGNLRPLRLCVSGSAPLPPELFHAVESLSGQTILERYGMTETMLTVSNPYSGERRPGTVGLPLPGVELRLAERDEIEVRGPMVFGGYWNRPEANALAFTEDGWFRTGDIGAFDDEGYLRIAGRTKELIISGGYNVYPREVEEALLAHPAIADAAVAGLPSPEWGEQVTAWVVADGLSASEVLDFARERLAPYKCPKAIRFVPELPKNALGKTLKHELV